MVRGPIKLDASQVVEIRTTYIPGDPKYGRRGLAKKYNVGIYTIRDIIEGRTWYNV